MKRHQVILLVFGVLSAVVCLGTGWFLFSAMAEKNEAAEVRNQAYAEVQTIYRGKVFPDAATIARVNEDQKVLEDWLVTASNLVHEGDLVVEAKSPTGFKQTLQATVRALSAYPGGVNGKVVAGGFLFGFDKYLGQSDSLPSSEHVGRLTRQLAIIEMLCQELYAAEILELKAVTRETFEEQAAEDQRRSEPQPASRRRRSRSGSPDVAASEAPQPKVTGEYFSKQRFTVEFLARPSAFVAVLNRLAAMKLFVVVAETEFRKTDDLLAKRSEKKKALADSSDGKAASVDPASLTHLERLVTDPELDPPVSVKLAVDVYSFEGV